MTSFGIARLLRLACSCSWPAIIACSLILPASVKAQSLPNSGNSKKPQPPNSTGFETLSPSTPESGVFSIQGGKRLMTEAESAVAAQNYSLAAQKLQDARQDFNQLSNFYQALTSSFLGIDNQASDSHRRKALETAQLRDQATYQLALVYRAQNQTDKAVPLLIEIIRSQNPTRDLGQKAYQQLLEVGFVDVPYPRQKNSQSVTPQPSSQLSPK